MPQFRKKPVVIEACQWTGTNADEVLGFTLGRASVRDASYKRQSSSERVLIIETLEGEMRAEPGDWIICGVKGEFYPCKPDIFAATYEPAGGALAAPAGPQDWQPIENADQGDAVLGGWFYGGDTGRWIWGECRYDHGWYGVKGGTPTHYLPLPPPPVPPTGTGESHNNVTKEQS